MKTLDDVSYPHLGVCVDFEIVTVSQHRGCQCFLSETENVKVFSILYS